MARIKKFWWPTWVEVNFEKETSKLAQLEEIGAQTLKSGTNLLCIEEHIYGLRFGLMKLGDTIKYGNWVAHNKNIIKNSQLKGFNAKDASQLLITVPGFHLDRLRMLPYSDFQVNFVYFDGKIINDRLNYVERGLFVEDVVVFEGRKTIILNREAKEKFCKSLGINPLPLHFSGAFYVGIQNLNKFAYKSKVSLSHVCYGLRMTLDIRYPKDPVFILKTQELSNSTKEQQIHSILEEISNLLVSPKTIIDVYDVVRVHPIKQLDSFVNKYLNYCESTLPYLMVYFGKIREIDENYDYREYKKNIKKLIKPLIEQSANQIKKFKIIDE